jgi:DNA polymerase-3 subunit delta
VILLHGEDTGLIRERALQATHRLAGTLDDPFRIALLDRETHNRLEEEATALSLMGGRRGCALCEMPRTRCSNP